MDQARDNGVIAILTQYNYLELKQTVTGFNLKTFFVIQVNQKHPLKYRVG